MDTTIQPTSPNAGRYWNPYIAGLGLGLTLLVSFVALGVGLGASGSTARIAASAAHAVAPTAVEANGYVGPWFQNGSALANYLVFMSLGTLLGGFVSALFARRLAVGVERGSRVTSGRALSCVSMDPTCRSASRP